MRNNKKDETPQLERAAFRTLYVTFYTPVFKFLYSLMGDVDEAEDLIQETFLKLYRCLENDRPPENPKAWIYRVAGNAACNQLKRRRTFRKILDTQFSRQDYQAGCEDDFIKSEELRKVRRALYELPVRDRVILMLYRDNFSYTDIAEMMKIKKTSVGKILARARLKLATQIKKGEHDEMFKNGEAHSVPGR